MKRLDIFAAIFAIALIAAAAWQPLAANISNLRALHSAGQTLERPPLNRLASPALEDLRRILSKNSHDPSALALSGDAEWQLGKTDQACASWAAAGDFRRLLSAGRYLERARRFDSADAMYAAAASIPSSDGSGDLALGALRWNRGDREGAIRAYQDVIARGPRLGGDLAYANLATLYAEQNRFREADTVAERGLALWPRSVTLRTTAGITYALSGRMALAAATLRKVWEENRAAGDACYWLGWTLARQGNDRAAVSQFSACLSRTPRDVSARYELGLAEVRLGELATARGTFQTIIAATPDHRGASDRLRELEQTVH